MTVLREMVGATHVVRGIPRTMSVMTLEFIREADVWVGTCMELGTSGYAETLDEARSQVMEAVHLQLNEVERLGFIKEYLREHGVHSIPIPQPGPTPVDRWDLLAVGA